MTTVNEDILKVLKGINRPISSSEIAKLTKRNPGSVRPSLRTLLKEGRIVQEFRGHYSHKSTQGVLFETPPRFQNLFIVASKCVGGEKIGVREEHKGLVHKIGFGADGSQLRIIFGYTRDKISWSLKAPRGIDYYGLNLATRLVEFECRNLGYEGLFWFVKNLEILRDDRTTRLEGLTSITLTDFQTDTLEKYYNKPRGVRREMKGPVNTTLSQLSALIYGGQNSYQMLQGVGVLSNKIDKMADVGKGTNRLIVDLAKTNNGLTDALFKLIDTLKESN